MIQYEYAIPFTYVVKNLLRSNIGDALKYLIKLSLSIFLFFHWLQIKERIHPPKPFKHRCHNVCVPALLIYLNIP